MTALGHVSGASGSQLSRSTRGFFVSDQKVLRKGKKKISQESSELCDAELLDTQPRTPKANM
jgi:hypothetical protein